jgi:8-oxo-dGTP pyrophosphatase MutT (NUDIX family)
MWLITRYGFFSIVEKPGDKAKACLTVRSRVREDLERLRAALLPELGEIAESQSNDYRFRAKASKPAVAQAMAQAAMDIDYSNFKNTVSKEQGYARAHLYGDVWSVLYQLQTPPPKKWAIAKAQSYGGVLLNDAGHLLLREPSNHYDGYVWTFAKGLPDKGDTPDQTALREVKEETGYTCTIVDVLPGVYRSAFGSAAYFIMAPIGQPGPHDFETQSIRWVPIDEAHTLISLTTNPKGKTRDLAVLQAAREWAQENGQVGSA